MLREVDRTIVRQLAPAGATPTTDSDPAMSRLLITDSLTELYNRTYFDRRLALEVSGAKAHSFLALYIIDLNGFKEFNDCFGHQAGDRALQEVAVALRATTPASGAACRLGGDEFAVLVPAITTEEAAWLQAELNQAISRCRVSVAAGEPGKALSGSVGLALAPRDGASPAALLSRADAAMYAAKGGLVAGAEPAPVRKQPPLLDRQPLLTRASVLLDEACSGNGQLLLCAGPAGVGKSRLAKAVTEIAADRGFTVVASQPMEQAPLAEVRRLAAALVAPRAGKGRVGRRSRVQDRAAAVLGLGGPPPDLTGPAPALRAQTDPSAVFLPQVGRALGQLLSVAASRQPLLWLLDDVQLADTATLAVLQYLAPQLPGLRLLLLMTARTHPATGVDDADRAARQRLERWWASVEPATGCHRWEVPPLAEAPGLDLVRWAAGGAVPRAVALQLVSDSGGNPLHILRLAGSLAHGTAPAGDATPATVAGVYAAELAALDEADKYVLYTAAVLGCNLSAHLLAEVAPVDASAVRQSLDRLVAAGWLEPVENRLRFGHPLARETVYQRIPAALRRSLHRLAGRILAVERDTPPGDLAWHFTAGADWVQARHSHRAAAAAAEAASAYSEAAAHYRDYLRLCDALDTPDPDAALLATRAGRYLNMAAESAMATELLQYALTRCQTDTERIAALLELAFSLYPLQDDSQAAVRIEECLRLLRPRGPSPELVQALARTIGHACELDHVERLPELTDELLAAAETPENPLEVVRWLAAAGISLVFARTDPDAAARCLAAVRQRLVGLRPLPSPTAARALLSAGRMAACAGRVDWAVRLLRAVIRLASASGDWFIVRVGTWQLADYLLLAGRLADAGALLQRGESLLRQTHQGRANWLVCAVQACRFRHDLSGMAAYAEQLDRTLAIPHRFAAVQLKWQAELALAQAAAGTASDTLSASWTATELAAKMPPAPDTKGIFVLAAEIQWLTGSTQEAERLLSKCPETPLTPPNTGRAQWLAGRMLVARGRWREALQAFTAATHRTTHAYYRACAHRDLAELLLETGAGSQANRHIASARRLFQRLENQHELARLADLEQRQSGQASPRRGAWAAAQSG